MNPSETNTRPKYVRTINPFNELEDYLKKILPAELKFSANQGKMRIYHFPWAVQKTHTGGRSSVFLNHQNVDTTEVMVLSKAVTNLSMIALPEAWSQIKAGKSYNIKDKYDSIITFNVYKKDKTSYEAFVEIMMVADWKEVNLAILNEWSESDSDESE